MTEPTSPPEIAPVNPAAKWALLAALLSWIPGVGFVAIGAGLVAGHHARAHRGVGRGRAFLGVALGILSLFVYAMLIGAFFEARARQKALPAVNATKRFILLVGSGQVADAKALTTDAIDTDRLTDTATQFQTWGGFNGDITPYAGKPLGEGVQVEYRLPFVGTTQIFAGDWVFVDGQPKLADYRLTPEDPAATRPGGPSAPAKP